MSPEEKQAIRDANMAAHKRICERLAVVDQVWADAWLLNVCTRGKRFGCMKTTKPKFMQKLGPEAGLLWETWNIFRGERAAARFGLRAGMSFGGLMMSSMSCNRTDGREAFDALMDALAAEVRT